MPVFVQNATAGINDYRYTIENDVQVTDHVFEFDLYIKDTDPADVFECAIIQAGVLINKSIFGTGTLSVAIVAGSSELVSASVPTAIKYASFNTTQGIIKLAAKAGPGCGTACTLSTSDPGTRVCRIRVTNTVAFVAGSQAGLHFSYTIMPYATKVFRYTSYTPSCRSTEITTNTGNTHPGDNYHNIYLNAPAPTPFAVTGGGSYCEGGAGPPVGLAGSQLGVTYTLYRNGIAQTPTYPGTGGVLAFGNKIGTYTYTVSGKYYGSYYPTATPMTGSVLVTMNPVPVITFNPLADVCVGSGLVPLSATPSGGVFTGSYVSGNSFNPSTIGTYPITYNITVGGCAAVPVIQPITVKSCTPTWSGLNGTLWNDPLNWLGNAVPLATDDVIIPSGCPHYPMLLLGSTTTAHNMVLGGGSKAYPKTVWFQIYGLLIVTGNLNINCLFDVGMDVKPGGALTVNGAMTICGNNLIVESQGSLITNGTVTGTANVQHTIAANLGWHLLSSPVGYQTICNGVFAPPTSAFPGDITKWDFYKWSIPCTPPLNHWINLRTNQPVGINYDLGTPPAFDVTRGYLVAYDAGVPTTKEFVGTPNTGNKLCVFPDVVNTCSWELLGNPFPSAIDWDAIDKYDLVNNYYYVWNQNKGGGIGGYEFYGGSQFHSDGVNGRIPSTQGFFVKVDPYIPGTKSLYLLNAARTHDVTGDDWLKDVPVNKLKITLSNGPIYDEAIFMVAGGSNVGQDRNDAEKLFNIPPANGQNGNQATVIARPQVYTIVDNNLKTCLNAMPYITNGTTIPVGIVAAGIYSSNYSITFSGMESFTSLPGLFLEDLELNVIQDLLQNPVYNFSSPDGSYDGRFLLHFLVPNPVNIPCTENFNGIGTNATVPLPNGWKVDKLNTVRLVGTYSSASTATNFAAGNTMPGNANNGIYNYGAGDPASATDRAVGGISSSSGSKSVNVYVWLKNNGTEAIPNLVISYDVEKYRLGINPAGFSIQMYYSTDGSTWTSAGSDFLTSYTGSDPGNNGYASAPGATQSVINKTLAQNIPAGGDFYLAWNYSVTSGLTTSNAQALGIDNVSICGTSNPISVSIASSANPVCAGTNVTFTANPVNGGTPSYQWKVNGFNAGTNSSTYTYIPVNGDQISVAMTSTLGCVINNPATSNTIMIQVDQAVAAAGPITGATTFSPGTSGVPYSVGAIPHASDYIWTYTGSGVTINGTETNVTLDFSSIATSGQLKVKGHNACGNGVESFLEISNTKPLNLSSIFLEGLYAGSGTMNPAYDESGPHWPADVADHITVELHNAVSYSTIVYSASVNLSTTGTATLTVPSIHNGSYYVTIKNRNGIETTTANPVNFSGTPISYTFDTQTKAYATNMGLMTDGVAVIYTGDENQDQIVDGTDLSDIGNLADVATNGYLPQDINGDGLVDGSDLSAAGNNADLAVGAILP